MSATASLKHLTFPTLTLARCSEAVTRAEQALTGFGGKEILGYGMSCGLWTDEQKFLRAYARALTEYADALAQMDEAKRIAKWNAGGGA